MEMTLTQLTLLTIRAMLITSIAISAICLHERGVELRKFLIPISSLYVFMAISLMIFDEVN